jgi:hypothetical protein
MVLTALIAAGSIKNQNTMESLGVMFTVSDFSFFDLFKTYCVDAITLFMSPVIIQNGRYYRKLEAIDTEEYDKFVVYNLGLHNYHYTLISISVIISTISSLFIPSAL